MFLDDIFDGKGSDNKLDIFNPAELLQNSWSDGSHQQIFAPPNPTNLLPSVELNSGSDLVQAKGFLSKIGLPDFGDLPKPPGLGDLPKLPGLPVVGELPKLPGLPNPGDLPKLPGLPVVGELPNLPGLPNPGDLPRLPGLPNIELPHLPIFGDLPQPPRLADLPRPPIPNLNDRNFPFPNIADIIGSSSPFAGPFLRTALENSRTNEEQPRRHHHGPHLPLWEPEHGGPAMWPHNPGSGSGHCPDNGVEEPIGTPRPVDVTGPFIDNRDPRVDGPIVNPCPIDETGGPGGQGQGEGPELEQEGPNYDNVTKQEIKDVMDKYFEDIDGSGANSLHKLFGFDKNGHVDSKEIMDFVTKNMDKLSDREIRVLLSASQKEHEISNAYDDEWGAETSGMSRSDISVWERQQPQYNIPDNEIVFRPYDQDPSILRYQDKRYPLPNSNEQDFGPSNNIDKHNDLRWWDKDSYDRGSLKNVNNRTGRYSI